MPARHSFQVVASSDQFEGNIIAVRVDEVTMPGGGCAQREVAEHFAAVAIIAINEAGQLALIEQYRHPVASRLLELPAGLFDARNESPVAAANRELVEEIGYEAKCWGLLIDVLPSPGFTDEAIRVFVATELTAITRPEAKDEELDIVLQWISVESAVQKIFSGEIVNATAVAAILAYVTAKNSGMPLRPADAVWTTKPVAFENRVNR